MSGASQAGSGHPSPAALAIAAALCCTAGLASGCGQRDSGQVTPGQAPGARAASRAPSDRRLFDVCFPPWGNDKYLRGELNVRAEGLGTPEVRLAIVLTLARPANEQSRLEWNRKTAYPQYKWMPAAWDEKRQWVWPNLAWLFKVHGIDRVERYGGWDPGKEVDNDFGAVLVRKCGADGQEYPDTASVPLVSAEWYPVDATNAGPQTVSHIVRSDGFTIHPAAGALEAPARGRIKVWFVYGDLFDQASRRPDTWPLERTVANQPAQGVAGGGAFAFFRVDWAYSPQGRSLVWSIEQVSPPEPTGFDWARWISRPAGPDRNWHEVAGAKPRLADRNFPTGVSPSPSAAREEGI